MLMVTLNSLYYPYPFVLLLPITLCQLKPNLSVECSFFYRLLCKKTNENFMIFTNVHNNLSRLRGSLRFKALIKFHGQTKWMWDIVTTSS